MAGLYGVHHLRGFSLHCPNLQLETKGEGWCPGCQNSAGTIGVRELLRAGHSGLGLVG